MSIFKRFYYWFKLRKFKRQFRELVKVQEFLDFHPRQDERFVDRITKEID